MLEGGQGSRCFNARAVWGALQVLPPAERPSAVACRACMARHGRRRRQLQGQFAGQGAVLPCCTARSPGRWVTARQVGGSLPAAQCDFGDKGDGDGQCPWCMCCAASKLKASKIPCDERPQLCCIAAAVGSHHALSRPNGFIHRNSLSKVHQVCHYGWRAEAHCWHMGTHLPSLGLAQAQPGLLHSEGAHVQKRGGDTAEIKKHLPMASKQSAQQRHPRP